MVVIFVLALCTQVAGTTQEAPIAPGEFAEVSVTTIDGLAIMPADFLLIDEDFGAWLGKSQHIKVPEFWKRRWDISVETTLAGMAGDKPEHDRRWVRQQADGDAFFKAHTVATVHIGSDGTGVFRIRQGRYFLVGTANLAKRDKYGMLIPEWGQISWNLPVNVNPEANRVTLSLTNSVFWASYR